MRKLATILLLLSLSVIAHAQAWSTFLDASRAIDWSTNGIGFTIPTVSTPCSVQPTGLLTGSTHAASNRTLIANSIASCAGTSGNKQVVNLPAGIFYVTNIVISKPYVVLRGNSTSGTTLEMTVGTGCAGGTTDGICIIDPNDVNNQSPEVTPPSGTQQCAWTAGYAQGTTVVTLNTCPGGAPPNGEIIVFDQANDSTDNNGIYICDVETANCGIENPAGGGGNSNGRVLSGLTHSEQQYNRVVSSTGSGTGPFTVTLEHGVYFTNIQSGKAPGAWWFDTLQNVGIENLTIDGTNQTGGASNIGNMGWYQCYQCWIQNVRSVKSGRHHIEAYQTYQSTVRDSYFYGALSGTSDSYGVEFEGSSAILVENNIFQQTTAPIMMGATTGTAILYNFSLDDFYTASPTFTQAAYYDHNAGNNFNLFEGNNFVVGPWGDDSWGSTTQVTLFRNMSPGWYVGKSESTLPFIARSKVRAINVIGGVYGQPAYHTFYQTYADTAGGVGKQCTAVGVCAPYTANSSNEALSVYSMGWITQDGTCSLTSPVFNNACDPIVTQQLMRWGNYDVVTNAVQWNSSEAAPAAIAFANANFSTSYFNGLAHTLPHSLIYGSTPAFWTAGKAWPPIGPDITTGNVGRCSGGTYNGAQAVSNGQCLGGSLVTAWGNHLISLPAMDCYLNTMGGPPDGTGSLLTYDYTNCPAGGGTPTASAPTFSPPAGTYAGTQTVTLTTSSSGAIICYSLSTTPATNGTTGCTTGTLYTTPVSVSVTSTLRAVAGGTGYLDSSVASAAYHIGALSVYTISNGGLSGYTYLNASIGGGTISPPYTGLDYVPLPGCANAPTPCTNPLIPAPGLNIGQAGCVPLTSNWTSAGCLIGAGYVITNGDNIKFGNRPIMRVSDAATLGNQTVSTASDAVNFFNTDSTVFMMGNTSGNVFAQGFNPAAFPSPTALAPFSSTAVKLAGSVAFSYVSNNILYDAGQVTCTGTLPTPLVCSDINAPEIDKITLGSLTSGGTQCTPPLQPGLTPCILSATKVFNFVTDSAKCLDSSYLPASQGGNLGWTSGFYVTKTDSSFTVGYSNKGGQQTGAVVANYTVGVGCRVWHTDSRIVTGDGGPTSCSTGTASCYDGTANQTNKDDVFNDWLDNTTYALPVCSGGTGTNNNGTACTKNTDCTGTGGHPICKGLIMPYFNNVNQCTYRPVQAGKSQACSPPNTVAGCTATYINWDGLAGGSCSSTTQITDGTMKWQASGRNGGAAFATNCGAGCTPISTIDHFTLHESKQNLDPTTAIASFTAPGLCLGELDNCQNTNNAGEFWTIATMYAASCYQTHRDSYPDWAPNYPLPATYPGGQFVFIYPRAITNTNGYYYKVTTGGTTSGSQPNWSTAQSVGATLIDGTVHYQAQSINGNDGSCLGHSTSGYLHYYNSDNFFADPFRNPGGFYAQSNVQQFADIHGAETNADPDDKNEFPFVSANQDNPTTGQWLNPGQHPLWEEIDAVNPSEATIGPLCNITHINITNQLLTVTCSNNFTAGDKVIFQGTTNATFLNNISVSVNSFCSSLPSNCSSFTAFYNNPNYDGPEVGATGGSALTNTASFNRYGHNFNSGSNSAFQVQNAISIQSQDGVWMLMGIDWEGMLGDEQGHSVCGLDSPIRSTFNGWTANHVYTKNFVFLPKNTSGQNPGTLYVENLTGASFTSGSTEPVLWNQTVGGTTNDNGNLWTTTQPPCRGDNFLMKLK